MLKQLSRASSCDIRQMLHMAVFSFDVLNAMLCSISSLWFPGLRTQAVGGLGNKGLAPSCP